MVIVIVAAVLAGAGLAAYLVLAKPVHHFAVVCPGVLYRSGQPSRAAFGTLWRRYHLKMVVNLRGKQPDKSWWQTENDFCTRHGVKLVDLDLDKPAETRQDIEQFLTLVQDPANQPLLVHCESGSARTGFAVAAYRIVHQHWSVSKALAEAAQFRFKPKVHLNPYYVEILHALAQGRPLPPYEHPAISKAK